MKKVVGITVWIIHLIQGGAFAHEGESHDRNHEADAQMKKLHHMMPMYAQAQTKINEALANGDGAKIEEETAKILATIPDLKNAMPHKNAKQIAVFRKIASAFAGEVEKTAVLAKTGDFGGAKNAFKFAQMRCNECHKRFRD